MKFLKSIFVGMLAFVAMQGIFAADAPAGATSSQEQEKLALEGGKIIIGRGERRTIDLSFVPNEVTSSSGCIKVDKISAKVFEITAVSTGEARLSFSSDQLAKSYYVTVTESNLQAYREFVRDFANCPEVSVERTSTEIILSGTVSSVENWEYFQRIITNRKASDDVKNYVIFRPSKKLYDDLKRQLLADGFKVESEMSPEKPGVMRFSISNETLSIAGYFNNAKDIERVKRIISVQKWLDPVWNKNNFKVSLDLTEVDTQIEVSIVFVGVEREQLREWGNFSADGTLLSWDVGGWLRALGGDARKMLQSDSSSGGGGYALMGTDFAGSLKFFGNNGITDFRDAGHITITNNGPVAEYSNGGTWNIKVNGVYDGDLKEIDYGTKYKVKGHFIRDGVVHLELDLERNLEPVREAYGEYTQGKMSTNTALNCPINSTAVIAGQADRSHEKDGPSGYGIFRNIPIINWVTGNGSYNTKDKVYLILVSPSITNPDKVKIVEKPSDITMGTEKEATDFIEPEVKSIRENEQKNWFKKMFVW